MEKYDTSKFRGIFVALNSLFDEDDNVNVESVKKLVRRYCETGISGVYVCGSSGEGFLMSTQERKLLLEAVVEEVKDELIIIAHVGAASTREAVELAKHAEKVGADAISAVPSVYYRLPEASIERHWSEISDSVDLPFIIYNVPQMTGYNLSLDLFKKMAAKDRVVGIKNTSEAGWQIERFKTLGGENFVVFNGPDEQYLGGRLMGADAGIGGTYGCMPELYVYLEKLIRDGNMEKAKIWQKRINECIFALLACPSLYGATKAVIYHRYGIETGNPRLPMLPVDRNGKQVAEIVSMIEKYVSMAMTQE